ncbi:MAG: hypothetical protein WCO73_06045 [Verrucomicrobiota bacterium]
MKFNHLLAGCLLLIASRAEETKPVEIEAHLQLLSMSGVILQHGYLDDKKIKPLDIMSACFTPEFTYHGKARFEILPYKEEETAEEVKSKKAAPTPAPLAWIDLPTTPGPHHLLLLIRPEPGQSGIKAIANDAKSFPPGSMKIFNLCSFPVEIHTPQQRTLIQANASALIRPRVAQGKYFDSEIHSLEDGVDRLGYNLHYFHMDSLRTLYFIFPGEKGTGQIMLKGIEDQQATPDPAANEAEPKKKTKK